ncbi:uncharacterized protein LOC135195569 [Macrobrachium nipponense]|uniref:uncharacterized protein LOC135195569 n=1 Tax=Macrobrachium nipponense TaxID=159736 RepID=UPI0030C89543
MVNCSTRWPKADPMADTSAAACASAFLSLWVSRLSVPDHNNSYRGTTFLGTQLHHTAAYHSESNDMIEGFHHILKTALMSCCNSLTWYSQLPWVLLGLQATSKEGIDLSAPKMVYGDPLVIPGYSSSIITPHPTSLDSGPSLEN